MKQLLLLLFPLMLFGHNCQKEQNEIIKKYDFKYEKLENLEKTLKTDIFVSDYYVRITMFANYVLINDKFPYVMNKNKTILTNTKYYYYNLKFNNIGDVYKETNVVYLNLKTCKKYYKLDNLFKEL